MFLCLLQKLLGVGPGEVSGRLSPESHTCCVPDAAPTPGVSQQDSGTPPGQRGAYPTGRRPRARHHTAGFIQTAGGSVGPLPPHHGVGEELVKCRCPGPRPGFLIHPSGAGPRTRIPRGQGLGSAAFAKGSPGLCFSSGGLGPKVPAREGARQGDGWGVVRTDRRGHVLWGRGREGGPRGGVPGLVSGAGL